MIAFIYYPVYLTIFWYKDVLGGLFGFFIQLNRYIASLLSLPLLIRTFFAPLKNEYREGLVLFSILFGVAIKSVIIFVSIVILCTVLLLEFITLIFVASIPILLIVITLGIGSALWYAK